MTATDAYEQSDKAIAHYQRIIAGSLSPKQLRDARLALIRAVGLRVAARARLEAIEANVEMVAA